MITLKRAIAALIVCFKPHVLLTLCILLVIAHSIIIAIQKGASNSWRIGKQHDLTLTMTTLILIVALIWAAFFIFIVRFELRNELESLLILFQCSKRGLRFLGVVGFHVALLTFVSLIVSATVERSIPNEIVSSGQFGVEMNGSKSMPSGRPDVNIEHIEHDVEIDIKGRNSFLQPVKTDNLFQSTAVARPRIQPGSSATETKSKMDRDYLLTVYKIWLTAIVYAFLYLVIENLVMFYADMTLVEFVHHSFLAGVARVTGIDLSDYPAGEMLFNPLVRHRIR